MEDKEPYFIKQGFLVFALALLASFLLAVLIQMAFISRFIEEQMPEQKTPLEMPKRSSLITFDRWGFDRIEFQSEYSELVKVICLKDDEKIEFDPNSPDWDVWPKRRRWLIDDIKSRAGKLP